MENDIIFGDARKCPRHPHVKTSSDDGMFDAPCGECEAEMADDCPEDLEVLCPVCENPGEFLGALGVRLHFRCRCCGMPFSHVEKE